jgi:predicted Fe-Mo cluster-binding NifX family protein
MRIAVSADTNNGLDSVVAGHFGRCPFFALVDLEGNEVTEVQVVDNPFYGNHSPGQVPGFIQSQNANVMLAGGMGRRAVTFFEQMGIEAATGASGTVHQAVENFLGGSLSGVKPCAESEAHHAAGHQH